MKACAAITVLVLLCGCVTYNYREPDLSGGIDLGPRISAQDVQDFLHIAGVSIPWWEIRPSDRYYSLIGTNWLLGVFKPGRKAMEGYEARDCDKIVLESMVEMNHRNIHLKDPPAYFSLKLEWKDKVEGHEVNIAIGTDAEVYVVDETIGLVCNWKQYPQAHRIKGVFPGRF